MNVIIIYNMAKLCGSFIQQLLVAFSVEECFNNSIAIVKTTEKLSSTITLWHFIYPNNSIIQTPELLAISCDQRGSENRGSTVIISAPTKINVQI